MDIEERRDVVLKHYGVIRRSGRYPWGSGGNAFQSHKDFKAHVDDMRSQGMTNPQIADGLGIKTTDLRDWISDASEDLRAENKAMAVRLSEKGMSNRAVAERMLGNPNKESTIRGWLATADEIKDDSLTTIAGILRGHLGTKRWLDIGVGTELYMGISKTRLRASVARLKSEGYKTWLVDLPQLGTDKPTKFKVLGHPDSTWKEAKDAVYSGQVSIVQDKSDDGGLTFMTPKEEPVSISSKRIEVRGAEDGGDAMDGVIEVRRGVPELYLGGNRYAQVRVAVDGTHYLKGMAMYADDLPAGTDIRFNSSKKGITSANKLDAMKPLKLSPEDAGNRFGAVTKRPMIYKDSKGKEVTSALNMVNEEGDWDKWTKSLSSQMLSKQSLTLATKQLSEARKAQQEELKTIMALTNPVVKKRLLMDFADGADSAAVHLKAAALPRQSTHAILPMNSMRPNEIYAPEFNNGERVALVRFPHGGPFEIPQLTVNNRNTTAKRLMGTAKDAVGIHHSVAKQLSGADFDGDSVLVIPNDDNRVKSRPALDSLKDFDPKVAYPEEPGMKYMTVDNKQKEMGKVSNLITDMTIMGAKEEEIAAAVRHSMVVIDAEAKNLNYKLSEKDNGILKLKAKYQGGATKGSSTIISRTTSPATPPQFRPARVNEGGPINPETGELNYVPTGRTYPERRKDPATGKMVPTGKIKEKITKTTKGALAKDAFTLVSDRAEPIENAYALHANAMKAMANAARKTAVNIKDPRPSPAAKAYYSDEVESLKAKLKNAMMNAPLERRAQAVGRATATARIEANPGADADDIKKIKYTSLTDARLQTGANKKRIGSTTEEEDPSTAFTQKEWDAVQAGAVSSTMLRNILNNSDMDRVKELATPRYNSSLTTGQIALAKSMRSSGRSLTEIAAALGIPRSTVSDNLANV